MNEHVNKKLVEARSSKFVIGFAAAVAFWFVISVETHTFFVGRALAERVPEDARINDGWDKWHSRLFGQFTPVHWRQPDSFIARLRFAGRRS